jgi:hypothetical protein
MQLYVSYRAFGGKSSELHVTVDAASRRVEPAGKGKCSL